MKINGRYLPKEAEKNAKALAEHLRHHHYNGSDEEILEAFIKMNASQIAKERTAYDINMNSIFMRHFLFTGKVNGLTAQVIVSAPSYHRVQFDTEKYVKSHFGLKINTVQEVPYWMYVCEYERRQIDHYYLSAEHQKERIDYEQSAYQLRIR